MWCASVAENDENNVGWWRPVTTGKRVAEFAYWEPSLPPHLLEGVKREVRRYHKISAAFCFKF